MVQRCQMDYYYLDEGQIHFSYSASANQYRSLTYVKYKKTFSLPSASQMRIVDLKLRHTKH